MAVADLSQQIDRLQVEVDLLRRLLELGEQDELEPFLRGALELVVQVSGARRGYLELRCRRSDDLDANFWVGYPDQAEEAEAFRKTISRGVVEEAIAHGETMATASALQDPRFKNFGSVKDNRIEAILCAPIGRAPAIGVVYLQDRPESGPFGVEDRKRVELFARHLAPLADRLLLRAAVVDEDPTAALRRQLPASNALVGKSNAVAGVLKQVSFVAPHDVGVLVTGATGTGKTLLARIIHQSGPRAKHPFVEVNCAALPASLIENELFGAVAGAHSTARVASEGKVAAAQHGSLFLDEVGELPLSAQGTLLQLLQSGQYFQVGGTRPRQANVRIIAATNVDLKRATQQRSFREDLYYRLNVLPVRMPGLDERVADIPLLASHICSAVCQRHNLPLLALSPHARHALETAEWPGHVRELSNTIEAAALRASGEGSSEIGTAHLFPSADEPGPSSGERLLTYQQELHRFKRNLILNTLDESDWNVTQAARRLDVARSFVHKLIRAFDLRR